MMFYSVMVSWIMLKIVNLSTLLGVQLEANLTNQPASPLVVSATDDYVSNTNGDPAVELTRFVLGLLYGFYLIQFLFYFKL